LKGELQRATDEHRPAQGDNGAVEPGRSEQGHGDEGDVEQHRGEGRHGKTVPGVENAAGQCHERHEQDVREGDASEFHSQGELVRLAGKPGRGDVYEEWCSRHAEQRDEDKDERQERGDMVDEAFCLGLA